VRILGIDPGYGILGWAIIEEHLMIIDFGVIETLKNTGIEDRLSLIYFGVTEIINQYRPDCVAIERLIFSANTKTALDVAKCIGVILLSAKLAGLKFTEYSPLEIKKSIVGYGRASKKQIQTMIMKIFNINEVPQPDDAADAIAIAVCHSLSSNFIKN